MGVLHAPLHNGFAGFERLIFNFIIKLITLGYIFSLLETTHCSLLITHPRPLITHRSSLIAEFSIFAAELSLK